VRPSWKKKKARHTQVFVIKQTSLDGFALSSRGLHRRADQGYDTKYGTKTGHVRQRVCNYCSAWIRISFGLSATISGTPRCSAIFAVTQTAFDLMQDELARAL